MSDLTARSAIDALIMLALGAGVAWRGYRSRRAYWTRGSWIRFGLTMLFGFALIAFGLYFSAVVGEPWTGARGSGTRSAWILVTLACLTGGAILVAVALMWFAQGEPERPFPFLRFRRASREVLSASSAEPLSPTAAATEATGERERPG